ncbi:MAG: glutamine synthetase [Polyangiaceae bacterium]|nr:glutamine synthetase [Polyangiaceae bacterium]
MAAKRRRTSPRTAASDGAVLVARLREQGVTRAKIGGVDVDGVLRGKYVSLDKLESALAKGFGFCDVIFGWDVADMLYDNARVTGWHTGYPDAHAVLDPTTLRPIPWEPGVIAMLCEFRAADGEPHPACPRSLLRRIVERARTLGYEARFGTEFEFYFFRETRQTLHQKGFRALEALDPGMFGYSWVRAGQDSELMRDLMEGLADFRIPVEGLHTETGPGVYEAALHHDDPLAAADKAALFKVAIKQIAHRHGLAVTFMAKWNENLPGASGHLHQSLWRGGKNVFFDPRGARGMSKTLRQYIAGQMALMRELTAIYSPTINSYKRYVPGVWAPLVASWGVDNRTCAIRVIDPGSPTGLRIEYRQTAADINPYLAIAACLASGLYGIEKGLTAPPETQGDAGADGPLRLPRTLAEANELLSRSKAARALFGAAFVDHYTRTRDWEVRAFDRAVTHWELERYFEVV